MPLGPVEARRVLENRRQIATQQKIVELIERTDKRNRQQRIYVIPSGKNFRRIPAVDLPKAMKTWISFCREFIGLRFTLVEDLDSFTHKREIVLHFNSENRPEWELRGTAWLADQLTDIVLRYPDAIAYEVSSSGISIMTTVQKFTPTDVSYVPQIIFTTKLK